MSQPQETAQRRTDWRKFLIAAGLAISAGGGVVADHWAFAPGGPLARFVQPPPPAVYFSPNGGCTRAVVDAVDRAKAEVKVQAYIFTSTEIAEALVRAHRDRGIKVSVIIDKKHGDYDNDKSGYLASSTASGAFSTADHHWLWAGSSTPSASRSAGTPGPPPAGGRPARRGSPGHAPNGATC